jgi:hypothetical protein
VSTSTAANKPTALALDGRFPPMEPTLGRRIHFVYSTGILWLSEFDAPRPHDDHSLCINYPMIAPDD